MRWAVMGSLIAACGTSPPRIGVLAYDDAQGALRRIDLAAGTSSLVDPQGPFSAIALAPDAVDIAYSLESTTSLDRTVFVAGAAGPTMLARRTGEAYPALSWAPGDALTYNVAAGGLFDTVLVALPDTTGRRLGTRGPVAVSSDGTRVAYVAATDLSTSAMGDLVIEQLDGSGRQMLAAGIVDPVKMGRTAIENAVSAAAILLTTEAAIAEIPEPKSAAPDMGGMGMDY